LFLGLALNDKSRQQFAEVGLVEQLVRVATSWCDDGVLVEACTCMANLSFRRVSQPCNMLLFIPEICVVFSSIIRCALMQQ
jgi:hypothetical protein